MLETKDKAIEILYRALPYSDQIKNLDTSNNDRIYFTWRGTRYKLTTSGHVYEIDGACEVDSDICIIMRELLKKVWLETKSA